MSYCNLAWGNSYSGHLNAIKLLQKKAVRIITHSNYNSPSIPLFIKMGDSSNPGIIYYTEHSCFYV